MAKIRRIIRKLAPPGRTFDEQLWPVYLALLVLGGYLAGIVLAVCRFDDVRIWANAITWLVTIPLAIGGSMWMLAWLDDRRINRRTLLALVLSLIANFVLLTATTRVYWVRYLEAALSQGPRPEERYQKVIPEYHDFQVNPREHPKRDFQKPVETEQPEPEPEELEKQQEEPEEAKPKPEKVEVPKPQEDVEPNSVERKIVEQSAPRRSETKSKLSRQVTQFKPKTAPPAAAVKVERPAEKQPSAMEAKATDVARQASEAPTARQVEPSEPATPTEAPKVDIARRETTRQEVAQSTSAPTLQRKLETPRTLPRTTAVAEQVTAPAARQTNPQQVKPNTTAAEKQQTSSTQVARVPTEPTPDSPSEVTQSRATRQQLADRMPQMAQSAKPVPNRRQPTVTMPQTNAVATAEPTPTTSRTTSQQQVRPTDSAVARTSTNPTTARAPRPTDAPQQTRPVQIAEATTRRAQSSEVPTANPEATPTKSPSRTAAQSVARVPTNARAVEVAAAQPAESTTSPRPAGVSANKQQTSTSAVAKVSSEPTPQPSTSVTQVDPTTQTRQQMAQNSSVMANTIKSVPRRLAPATSNPSPANVAAATLSPTRSPVKSDSPSPAPSSSAVARQAAQATSSSTSPQAMETPTKSPTTELARAQATRATASQVPTINPTARPTNSPSRSTRASIVPASPVAKAAPAAASTARTTSRPSAEPARTALNKAFGGTAGIGRSANMDRNTPAAENPAAVASGSARRAQATQQMETGPALSPSAPARIARSRAGANAPSATRVAVQQVDHATVAGAPQAAELEASASAALERQASNTASGPVTAARGEIEVDLGATKVVSENSTGKASGGGQPRMNFETRSHKLARSEVGGAPDVRLAETEVAEVAQAPRGDGGGEPATPEISPEATAVARTEQGGGSPVTGGPASMQSDPSAESASSQEVAEAQIGRAETIEAATAKPVAGGGSGSPARAATGPKLLENLIASAATPVDAGNPPQGTPEGTPPMPTETELARAEASGGAPTAGGPAKASEVGLPEEEEGEEGGAESAIVQTKVGRATAIDSTVGKPSAGGGTASPTRASTGPTFATSTKAEVVALAGAPTSSGIPQGATVEPQGADAAKTAEGVAGKASGEPAGAMSGLAVVDAPMSGDPGSAPGAGRASPANVDGPQVGGKLAARGPFKKSGNIQLPTGTVEQVAMADVGGGALQSEPDVEATMGGMDSAGMSRQAVAGGLPVEVSAPEGPGGLGDEVALDAGTMSRRSQAESQEVHFREARFIRTRTGGPLAINVAADLGTKAFSGRSKFKNKDVTGQPGVGQPPPKTEKSIELGLRFLARHQSNDGSWSLSNFGAGRRGYEREKTALHSDVAATGLCLLAFLGAGYHHQDDHYKDVVAGGIDYLLKNQKANGDLFVDQDPESSRAVWLYSHGICTIALCEAYGMTQDPDLRGPAQKAIDFIVESQNKDLGGWRYSPGYGSDTSVTGWMMMALKSGELARLDIPRDTFDRIEDWLNEAQESDTQRHLYVYNPLAPDTPEQRHGLEPSKTMTSVGLLMRLYSGWRRDNSHMIKGARYLMQNLPANGTRLNNERDTYYWYYATQVMFHMGGKFWEAWNERLHPLLVDSQITTGPMAGSWDPRNPVPDRWAPHAGRIYVTTMNLLSLEVYYRHLPIYEDTAK